MELASPSGISVRHNMFRRFVNILNDHHKGRKLISFVKLESPLKKTFNGCQPLLEVEVRWWVVVEDLHR